MTLDETANKNQQLILHALAQAHQNVVANKVGVHESTISRMKEKGGLIETAAYLIAALDLKVVAVEERTYRPDLIQALHTLAALALEVSPELMAMKAEKS